MKLIKFGATDLPSYNPYTDVSTGSVKSTLLPVVGGYFNSRGSEQGVQEPGLITKRFLVDTDTTTLEATFKTLRALIGVRQRLYRQWKDDSIEWCWATLLKISSEKQPRHNLIEAVMEFERESIWFGNAHGDWYLDDGYYLDSGMSLDQGDIQGTLTSGANNIDCPNDGNAQVFEPIITITAGTGANITAIRFRAYGLTDPSFNVTRDFTWTGTLTAGDVLRVDCGAFSITKNGTGIYDQLTNDEPPYWLIIPVGGANLIINCTGTIGSGTTYEVEYWEASQ